MRGIAIGDVHLCDKAPICRKDDWYAAQLNKLQFVVIQCIAKGCPLFIAGDLYDKWDTTFKLVNDVNNILSQVPCYHVAGNHDLPYHSMVHYTSSPLSVTKSILLMQGKGNSGASYGEQIQETSANVLIQHRMVYLSDPVYGHEGDNYDVTKLFETAAYKDRRLVITGDNHKAFVYRKNERQAWLNTGPVFRTSVTEKEYAPKCWYVDTDNESTVVEAINIPHDVAAVDRTEMYLEQVTDTFVSAFAEQVKMQESVSTDFMKQVEALVVMVDEPTKEAVYKSIQEAESEG